jgi:transmembrane sensor
MTPLEFQRLLDKYARGACNAREKRFVEEWFKNIDNPTLDQDTTHTESLAAEKRVWAMLNRKVNSRSPFKYRFLPYAAVLSLLIVLSSLFFLNRWYPSHRPMASDNTQGLETFAAVENTTGAVQLIVLDDQSQITLQPNSKVMYRKNFLAEKREVFLTGEAFFSVTRDTLRPFIVYSKDVVTRVLGTSFTIKAYEEEEEVTIAVKTGKVSVVTHGNQRASAGMGGKEIILVPNQKIVYDREKDSVSKRLVEKPELIRPQPALFEMEFDAMPVAKIFEALTENYGIDIAFDKELLAHCTITTSLTDEDFYERVEIICKAIGADYEITEEADIVIHSNGCN